MGSKGKGGIQENTKKDQTATALVGFIYKAVCVATLLLLCLRTCLGAKDSGVEGRGKREEERRGKQITLS